jgi:hypothetical protein
MEYTVVLIDSLAQHIPSFCGGYDLTQNVTGTGPTAPVAEYMGALQHSVVDLWTSMLDLSKPSDVLQVNKGTIHRATDHMGMRQALRAGTVNGHSEGGREFIDNIRELGVTAALSIRDHPSTTAIPATD